MSKKGAMLGSSVGTGFGVGTGIASVATTAGADSRLVCWVDASPSI